MAPFRLVQVQGQQQIQVQEGIVLDAEQRTSYICKVQASAAGQAVTSTADISIIVTNIDEPPVFTKSNYNFVISEDAVAGSKATGTFPILATDPEGASISYRPLENRIHYVRANRSRWHAIRTT